MPLDPRAKGTNNLIRQGAVLCEGVEDVLAVVSSPRAVREPPAGWEGEPFSDDEIRLTREWLRSKANSIEGGTSEIQLNIIAKRVLALPD